MIELDNKVCCFAIPPKLTTVLVISCNSHTPPPTPGSLIKGEEKIRLLILRSVICGALALLVRSGVTPQHSAGDTVFIITVIQLETHAGEVGDVSGW